VIEYRRLEISELVRVAEIDRTERIETLYVQHGTHLEPTVGDFNAAPWRDGAGPHSVNEQIVGCEHYLTAGGTAIGAFAAERLVAIGIVVPHVRPGIAQLAYLHVSDGFRGEGIGVRLTAALERIARDAGDDAMVVSATPSANTVSFYLGRGFAPTAAPLPELLEMEPEDVHLEKRFGP
jgi:GNAT superfamily N-acetyltransferase